MQVDDDWASMKELELSQPTDYSRYRRLQRCYLRNRKDPYSKPLPAYENAVMSWALQSKAKKHEHCETLLRAVANPMMLNVSLRELIPKLKRREKEFGHIESDPSGKWNWLRNLQTSLIEETFCRSKYQKYKIPKLGKQGYRTIEVPCAETRVVVKTMQKVLVPLLDPAFYQLSIGFRPNRSTLHGLAAVEQLRRRGMEHWVKCDIRDAFGQIPKPTLLEVLNSRLHGSPIMWLVEEVLDRNRKRGIPQGISISPLAMNVYLDHFLDNWWVKRFPDTCLVRYADDILITCRTRQSAIEAFEALQNQAKTIGMPLNERQTDAVFDLSRGDVVDWLGFQIQSQGEELNYSLGPKSWDRLKFKFQEVKERKAKGESYMQTDITSIGFGRVLEKAVAIEESKVAAVARQIRELANEANLDITSFTDEEAADAWCIGQQKWHKAREDVLPWLPAN